MCALQTCAWAHAAVRRHTFLAAARWGRCSVCHVGCPICTLWGTILHELSGEKGIPHGPVFYSFCTFSVLHFQVTFSTRRPLQLPGWRMPVAWLYRTACCCMVWLQVPVLLPAASAQGGQCLFPCHLQLTSSSFSLWPEDFCLGSHPDVLLKQRAEAVLGEEVLHMSGELRVVCSRQRLVCWSHLSLSHATHVIQVTLLLSSLTCSCICYFQIRSPVPPSPSYHHWACSFH